jgi:hypothetical protein
MWGQLKDNFRLCDHPGGTQFLDPAAFLASKSWELETPILSVTWTVNRPIAAHFIGWAIIAKP